MFVVGGYLLVFGCLLISVMYFTMLERKMMSYMQLRKGPKKVFFLGLLTPICDSIKLFFKGFVVVLFSNEVVFLFAPLLSVFFLMVMWLLYPFAFFSKDFYFGVVVFFCVSSLKVYSVLGSGWGSNSKYSLLGSIRGAAQVVSYELVLVFVMLVPLVFQSSFSFGSFLWGGFWYGVLVLPLWVLWVICCVAETNRSPFDFSEGESELVSGFKTEYSSLGFAFLFLGEYGQIMFMSMVSILMFFSFGLVVVNMCVGVMIALSFIWFRSTFPRFRYDLLMEWCWAYCLVFVFFFFFYCLVFVFLYKGFFLFGCFVWGFVVVGWGKSVGKEGGVGLWEWGCFCGGCVEMYFGFKNFVSLVGLYLDMFHDNCLVVIVFVSVFVLVCVLGSFFFSGGFMLFLNVGEQLMEFWWTMFPGVILFSLVAPSLYGLYYLDMGGESLSKGLVVVVAKQWYWVYNVLSCEMCDVLSFNSFSQLFQFSSYYDFLLLDGFRYLEVDVPLFILVGQVFRFLFSSGDVVHSYCVPELAVKMDCVPGRYNQSFLFLHVPGKYFGSCVEICGVGHSMMPVCVEGVV